MSEETGARRAARERGRPVYDCPTCEGRFAERTVEAVLKRAAASRHGDAITPEIERVTTTRPRPATIASPGRAGDPVKPPAALPGRDARGKRD